VGDIRPRLACVQTGSGRGTSGRRAPWGVPSGVPGEGGYTHRPDVGGAPPAQL